MVRAMVIQSRVIWFMKWQSKIDNTLTPSPG